MSNLGCCSNALGYSTFRCNPDLGVLQIGIRAKVIENQQSCLLRHLRLPTLLSIPILSQAESSGEPMRRYLMEAFRLEDPQTPPVPQDEDERELMFIQAHDLDYVPEPIYLEYIPLEEEHELPDEEQPLPHVDSPTAESPGYITELDPEEDPEEYGDDETEDGPIDYPMDGGDDGDDDDGNSSRDDADDKDEDDEEEEEKEEEEHLALADSAIVVPTDEPVSPLEGTEPAIPPPSTNITIGARITVRPQASISLLPGAEVERLLAMTTPSPSPPILLSPPSAEERLASTIDAEARRQGISEVGYGIRDTWVDPTEAVLEDLYALLVDAQDSRSCISQRVDMDSQWVDLLMGDRMTLQETVTHQELQTHRDHMYAHETHIQTHQTQLQLQGTLIQTQHHVHETRFQMQQDEIAALRETDHRRQAQITETLRVMRDMRREMGDMKAELLALREQRMRARQPAPDARIPDHQDASGDADSHI
ncbi:hypothetical protein Tco_1039094 [Tanacetum coccineum]